jgi:hypothetical protein
MKEYITDRLCFLLERYLNKKFPPTGTGHIERHVSSASFSSGRIPYGISLVNVRKAIARFGPHSHVAVRPVSHHRGISPTGYVPRVCPIKTALRYPTGEIFLHT